MTKRNGEARVESKSHKTDIMVMVLSKHKRKAKIVDNEGQELKQVESFKYLGETLSETGGSVLAVRARAKAA